MAEQGGKQTKVTNEKSAFVFVSMLLFTVASFSRIIPHMLWSLTIFFMVSQVNDRSTMILEYDCPTAMINSPIREFHFQEFNFSSYLKDKRKEFVGRKWFFLELESIFEENSGTSGVLITGEPRSGKSALMSHLICSPHSSLLIHQNTIGYHLCGYPEKGQRNGTRFVRNLVDQIAARLPEYSKHVTNSKQIRTELDTVCHKNPRSCFFDTIERPLQKLKKPDGPRFIIIDALDKCFESDWKTSEIMDILKSKIPHFPNWLKVILTSRNLTSVTSRLPQELINRMPLYATDERNVKDIRYYTSRLITQNKGFFDKLLTAMNIGSKTDNMKFYMDQIITLADENFSYLKILLLNDVHSGALENYFSEDRFGLFKPVLSVMFYQIVMIEIIIEGLIYTLICGMAKLQRFFN